MSKGDDTKTKILEKALDEVSVFGLEGLTIGKLADKLNISKSGLFAHFGSKEKLQIEILNHHNRVFKKLVLYPVSKAKKGVNKIKLLFKLWNEYTLELTGGCIWVSLTSELDDQPGPARDFLAKSVDILNCFIVKYVKEAITLGEFKKKTDPKQFAQEFWGIHLAHHQMQRLLADQKAGKRANKSFQALLSNYKTER